MINKVSEEEVRRRLKEEEREKGPPSSMAAGLARMARIYEELLKEANPEEKTPRERRGG